MKASPHAPPILLAVLGIGWALAAPADATDAVVMKSGLTREGRITGVSGGNLRLQVDGGASTGIPLADVREIRMAPPAEFDAAVQRLASGDAKGAVDDLQKINDAYAGLPAPWAQRAAALLGDAALAGLGRQAPRARAILLEALGGDDEDLQASAAEVIGDRGKAAAGFSAALAKVAGAAADAHTRAAAITAIGDIGAADQPAALAKALDDDDADVRHAAAYAIADLPDAVPGLAKEIIAAADDDDVRVRMEIAPLLAALGTPDATKALRNLADDDDDNVADVARGLLPGKDAATR